MARVGEKAPEFNAEAFWNGQIKRVSSKDFKGKWIVLFFYPMNFSFVSPTEIQVLAKKEPELKKLNAQIIAASTDSPYAHKAWYERELHEVEFPVLSDTSLKVSKDFGVLIEQEGVSLRGTFIIDPNGIIQHSTVNNLQVGRSIEESIRVLKALQSGQLCPAEWKDGEKTFGKA